MARTRITITLDEDTARWAETEAGRRETSVSGLIRRLLEEARRNQTYEAARHRYLSIPSYLLNETGAPYPTRDEIHERRVRTDTRDHP